MLRLLTRTVVPAVAALLAFACASASHGPSIYVAPSYQSVLAGTDTTYALHRQVIFVIWVSNNSSVPIVVTGVQLMDCENTDRACGVVPMRVRVLPGGRENVTTVRPRDPELAWGFRYTFTFERVAN